MSTFYQKKMKQNGFLKDTILFKDDNILTRQTGLMTGAYSAWWFIILWLPTVSKQSLLSALTSMSSVVLFYINYIHAEGICFVGNKNWNNSPINRTQTVGLHSVPDSSRLSRRGGGGGGMGQVYRQAPHHHHLCSGSQMYIRERESNTTGIESEDRWTPWENLAVGDSTNRTCWQLVTWKLPQAGHGTGIRVGAQIQENCQAVCSNIKVTASNSIKVINAAFRKFSRYRVTYSICNFLHFFHP